MKLYDDHGQLVAEIADAFADVDNGINLTFNTVANLLGDERLSTVVATGRQFVRPGDHIVVAQGNHAYRVASDAASDFDVVTAGGVKLNVLAGPGSVWAAEAFGVSSANASNDDALFAMRDAALRVDHPEMRRPSQSPGRRRPGG